MIFIIPNGKRVEVEDKKVKEIVTTRLSPIFYWQYLKSISEEDVLAFFDKKADFETVKKICWYILFHAENLVFSGYLLTLGNEGAERAENYLEYNRPLLEELRKLYNEVKEDNCYEIADKMISECLRFGIDPF